MVKVYLLLVACLSLSITAVTGPIVALTAISNLEQNAIKTVAPRRIPVARNIDFAPKALRSLEHSISGPIVELEEAASVKYKPLGRSIRSREIAYSPEAKLSLSRRPNDIVVPHNEYSQTQGQIGSCHIFTMAQVLANMIFRETGKYLDPASYFSDHLAKQASTRPKNPVESFSNSHIKDVANIKIHGPDCSMYEEGSYFYDDLKLIQMVGSELLGSSSGKEYSTLVRAIGDLKAAKTALLNSKVELDLAAKQAKLERPAKAILSRSVFGTGDKESRELVKQIVKSVKFTKVDFNQRYGMLPIDKAYSSAKKDLIDSLHKNGVLWLTVEYNLYSGNGNANLAESLFSSSGDHAVALVGYKTDGDLFLIRDSNKAGLKLLSANNLLPSINEAFALKK